jgi:hypothetical protein
MNKTKFTLGKCSIPVFFATNCTKDKGCSFEFGVKVGVGESSENVPLVYSGIHNPLFNANFHAKLKKNTRYLPNEKNPVGIHGLQE